jgi:hypothetical protein
MRIEGEKQRSREAKRDAEKKTRPPRGLSSDQPR